MAVSLEKKGVPAPAGPRTDRIARYRHRLTGEVVKAVQITKDNLEYIKEKLGIDLREIWEDWDERYEPDEENFCHLDPGDWFYWLDEVYFTYAYVDFLDDYEPLDEGHDASAPPAKEVQDGSVN
jgi:hypothetical protein